MAVRGIRRARIRPAIVGLALLCVVPVTAGVLRIVELAGDPVITEANARFVAAPAPAVLHIVSASAFLVGGVIQVFPSLRRRWPRWHRLAGRVLLPAGLLTAVSGLWLTLTYPWPDGDGLALYLTRLVVGVAMTAAVVQGGRNLLLRRYQSHGEWMLRAYALGAGAGTQAVLHLPFAILADAPTGGFRAFLMAAGWAVNVVLAEWIIRTGRLRGRRPTRGSRRSAPVQAASG